MITMRLEQNPIYRKKIVPWYDSEPACFVLLAGMVAFLLFGIMGVTVARRNVAYLGYQWVPLLVVGLSGAVSLSLAARLLKRYLGRRAE